MVHGRVLARVLSLLWVAAAMEVIVWQRSGLLVAGCGGEWIPCWIKALVYGFYVVVVGTIAIACALRGVAMIVLKVEGSVLKIISKETREVGSDDKKIHYEMVFVCEYQDKVYMGCHAFEEERGASSRPTGLMSAGKKTQVNINLPHCSEGADGYARICLRAEVSEGYKVLLSPSHPKLYMAEETVTTLSIFLWLFL